MVVRVSEAEPNALPMCGKPSPVVGKPPGLQGIGNELLPNMANEYARLVTLSGMNKNKEEWLGRFGHAQGVG